MKMNFNKLLLLVLAGGTIFFANQIFAGDSTTNDVSLLSAEAIGAFKSGNYDAAIAGFTKLIQLHATDAYLGRGITYDKKQQYEKAITDLTEAIWRRPSAIAYKSRGDAYSHKKDYAKAVDDYSEAIKLNPKNGELYVLRAERNFFDHHYDVAFIDCNTAILLLTDDSGTNNLLARACLTRGYIFIEKNDAERAIVDFNKVIQLDSQNAPAYAGRGLMLSRKGKYDMAISDYKIAIHIDPNESTPYNFLGWIQAVCPDAKYQDGQKALENAKKACELSAWKEPLCLGTLAAAYAETGNFDEAVKWQKKSIELGLPEKDLKEAKIQLDLYQQKKPYHLEK